jgi:hypothetical protein
LSFRKMVSLAVRLVVLSMVIAMGHAANAGIIVQGVGAVTGVGGANSITLSSAGLNASLGGIFVAHIVSEKGSGVTLSTPDNNSGWTLIQTINNSSNVGQSIYWRAADASSSFQFNFNNSQKAVGAVYHITGVNMLAPVQAFGSSSGSTSTSSAPSVTGSAGSLLLTLYGHKEKEGIITSSGNTTLTGLGMTQRYNTSQVGGSDNAISGYTQILPANTTTTGVRSAANGKSGSWVGTNITFAAAPPPDPDPDPVPEPSGALLAGMAILIGASARSRRKHRKS